VKSCQAVLIAGNHSRRGREAYETLPQLLRQRGIDIIDTYFGEDRVDVCKRVRRAIKRKERLIVVCGGDGTHTSVVPFFAKTKSTLGVVPAGTGNSFALGLGIDSFESAADAIAYGRKCKVDLGVVNGTYFANFLTVGLAAQIAQETSRGLKSVIGPLAYGVTAVVPMLTHRPFKTDIRWKQHHVKVKTHQIIVASGRFYGHQPLKRDASVTDGKLTTFVRDRNSRLDVVQTYLALLRGEQMDLSGVRLWSTSGTVKIATKKKAPVAVDGCAFGKTPIRVWVEPGALRVMTRIDVAAKPS
jgi:diacylglycerol kinase (ATP)